MNTKEHLTPGASQNTVPGFSGAHWRELGKIKNFRETWKNLAVCFVGHFSSAWWCSGSRTGWDLRFLQLIVGFPTHSATIGKPNSHTNFPNNNNFQTVNFSKLMSFYTKQASGRWDSAGQESYRRRRRRMGLALWLVFTRIQSQLVADASILLDIKGCWLLSDIKGCSTNHPIKASNLSITICTATACKSNRLFSAVSWLPPVFISLPSSCDGAHRSELRFL